ncbi:conserved hypothetical protein [Nitrobacter winogradskyi Nb-255]|uniref:Uncharacterized protein n=1 Tax=Nitrobacter winogradskyi (strain ATCC 25391 / DSM 10237 / CIP 104748 / NCIMB 11846 / Nb-255) TaxID=323098 RepID=Q3SSE2_NITWN|nr:hypothetical protein [Nitrobacter winogradskyi]ABA04799.1 conserved hypothetical protein [Nitrobacter winogradskyi Nb-255]
MSEAKRFDDLPPATKEFLTNLRPDEIKTLNDGIRLINSALTVGRFMKWVIITMLGILAGIVMFGESISKIASWMKGG